MSATAASPLYAPRFGIVDQAQAITFRVEDQGGSGGSAQVTIRRDGETIETRNVAVGQPVQVDIHIPHAGPNIVEIEASPLQGELTAVNNRAVLSIDGVREKLRVLLVSGEPHAGERTWRNLLHSDAMLISCTSPFCARRKNRTARRSMSFR